MAVNDPTTNFNWDLPNVAGDAGNWGAKLNTIFGDDVTGIDKKLGDVQTTANAALPKAGGVMTGRLDVKNEAFTAVNLGATLSGTVTCDLATGNFFYGTMTGNVTIAFSNIPAGAVGVLIELTVSGAALTIAWPSGARWPNAGSAPSGFTSGRVQVFALYTRDGGTKWRASHIPEFSA